MTAQDLFITPVFIIIFLAIALMIRPLVTNSITRPYFIPGLLVKFVGAISLGLIYQFYYGGGDTFTFHTHGSKWIWKAFMDDPALGIKILFQEAGDYDGETFVYTSRIWMFRDKPSWLVIKIAAFFDIFTYGTYSSTALFFASFAFSGHWVLFSTFQKAYPDKTRQIALTTLFIPSVIFWGSGILKDSITLSALCWICFGIFNLVIYKKTSPINIIIIFFMGWLLLSVKIYILLCFMVAVFLFLYLAYISKIQNPTLRVLLAPFVIIVFLSIGYFAIDKISETNSRYALDKIGETAMITAYDIRYGWGARQGDNSGYTLGELDGSLTSLIKLAPQAIIVTLFRPWLWEVRNPLMLLSAIESLSFLLITIRLFANRKNNLKAKIKSPIFIFCISFSLLFAFAIGVSTFNFGTLMRYKIPTVLFYALALLTLSSKMNPTIDD